MKTDEVRFGHFFSTAKTQYVIPRWQRRFSWTRTEIDELWRDVQRVGKEVARGNPLTHFLGSVVVQHNAVETVVKPSEAHQYFVIDGQQRLASMALFLCALRDSEVGTISAGRDEITNQYLINASLKDASRPRIVMQAGDNDAFRAVVGEFPVADEQHLIVQAYRRLLSHLNGALGDPEFGRTVQDRADTFLLVATEYLTAVWMALDAQDNAHRIFQTINAGGRPLEHFDLVRNFFFLRLSADSKTADRFFEGSWVPMEERLAQTGATPRAYMQSWSNSQGRTGAADQLYQNIVKDLEYKLPLEVMEYGERFTSSSADFLPLVAETSTSHPGLDAQLARFRLLGQTPQSLYGLLFTALVYFRRDQLSGDQAAQIVEIATGYLVRRQLSGFPTQLHNATFADSVVGFVNLVHGKRHEPHLMPDYLRTRLSLGTESRSWPDDSDVTTRGLLADLYTSGRRRPLTRVVLGEIDRSMRGFANSGFSLPQYSKMHIEHIMPQSLSAEWISDFLDWGVEEPAQKHKLYLHSIGNLTLLESEPNVGIANARFAEKREKCFSTESLVIANELAMESIWTDNQISARASRLLKEACSLFLGPLRGDELAARAELFGLDTAKQGELESDEFEDEDFQG